MADHMKAPENGAAIRMYRQGLGDCFLLAFKGTGDSDVYVLIDCGILVNHAKKNDVMARVAEDIRDATGGHLHTLVITHEHYDHISGWRTPAVQDIFIDMQIDEVWSAWTEDDGDAMAADLQQSTALHLRALQAAAVQMNGLNHPQAGFVEGLLGFSQGVRDDMEFALSLGGENHFCLSPGLDPFPLPGTDNVRVYVLGPPKDEDKLKQMEPRKEGEGYKENHTMGFNDWAGFHSAVFRASRQEGESANARSKLTGLRPWERPFDEDREISPEDAECEPFFAQHYGSDGDENAWRRIDGDWLNAAADLALQVDNMVNNTSLVLAFEFIDTGHILLFPADAQLGNILSWHDYSWTVDGEERIAEDLLARTVFYKVGHHGSHNATLKDAELELMTSDDLVAMIPVDEEMARDTKDWDMPFGPMLEALQNKAKHRIIQLDKPVPERTPDPSIISQTRWRKFLRNVEESSECFSTAKHGINRPLYHQYNFPNPPASD